MRDPSASSPPPNQFGAFPGRRRVGGMLGHRQAGEQLLPELLRLWAAGCPLSAAQLAKLAAKLNVSEARVYGVATFYDLLEVPSATTPHQAASPLPRLRICDGPVCCFQGAHEIPKRLESLVGVDPEIAIDRSSCLGLCNRAPAMLFNRHAIAPAPLQMRDLLCATKEEKLDVVDPDRIVDGGELFSRAGPRPFFQPTPRRANGSHAPPMAGLQQALTMTPAKIIEVIKASGLRGFGGAGFATGRKWDMAAEAVAEERFVICNADESEPGTFKDRVLMEQAPLQLLEGMIIAARAIGAGEGFIYVRGEYDRAARAVASAIEQATENGLLGENLLGSSFSFHVRVHRGAGAYICGEETALLESLEGKRGEPRSRPPFPVASGYRGCPTLVNNVETFGVVPFILQYGADAFRELGVSGACGSKLYCLSGHVARPAVYEAPLGTSLGQLLELAGGVPGGRPFQFALTGGAAGTFVGKQQLDVPLGFDAVQNDVSIGSGAVIVADDSLSVVDMLSWIMQFFVAESCGKCTPCRVGTVQARDLIQRIQAGNGKDGDVDTLTRLAATLEKTSLCGLGQSVAWPIRTALRRFREDFARLGAS